MPTVAIYRPRRLSSIPFPSHSDWMRYYSAVGTRFEFLLALFEYVLPRLIDEVVLAYWQAVPLVPGRGYGGAACTPCTVAAPIDTARPLVMCSYGHKPRGHNGGLSPSGLTYNKANGMIFGVKRTCISGDLDLWNNYVPH